MKQKKEKKTTEAGQPLPGKSTKAKDAPTSSSVSEPKKTVDGWTSTSNSTVDAEASDSPSVPIKKKKSSVAPPPAQTAPPKPASSAGKILEKQGELVTYGGNLFLMLDKRRSPLLRFCLREKRPVMVSCSHHSTYITYRQQDTSDSSEEDEEDDSVLLNPELQAFIKAEAAALIAGMIPSSKTAKLPSATPSTTAKPPTATSTGAQVPSQVNGTPSPSTTPPANCIICGATPHHLRNRCPVVKGGIKSMRSRISELESTEPDDKQPAALITEAVSDLKAMIQKKQDQNKKMNGKEKEVRPRTKSEGKETTNKKQTEDPADGDRESDGEEVQTPRVSQVAGVDVAYVGAARAELSSETEEPEEGLVSTKVASGSKETSGKISKSATTITSTPKVKESFDKVTTSTVTSKHQRHSSLQSPAALTLDTSTPNPFSPFLDFGDLSQYNDKDLEDIIRGPRLSVADVPSEDEDLDEEVPGQLLDDDDDDLRARKRNKLNYAGSSEEEDEEEDVEEPDQDKESDDEDARNLKAKDLAEEAHSSDSEKSDDDTGDASKEASKHRDGADQDNLSFGEIDAREGNSPIEVDLLGALGALEGDVSIVSTVRARSLSSQPSSAPLPPASQRAGDSDTLVGKNDKTSSPEPTSEDEPPAGSPKPAKTPSTQETPTQRRLDKETVSDLDPIEPVHEEIASPADPIHSDDETTQITVAAPRTRSQRNKFTSQLEKAAPAETNPQSQVDDQKTPRKRRSLSRLSELPVPPHPKSTRKGKAPSSVQPEPAEPQEEADEEQPPGTRKSARNKKPAPAKPLSKVSARRAAVPEEDPSADRAKDAGPSVEDQEEEDAVPVTRGKGANKPTKAQTKVPPRTPTKPPARSTRSRKGTSSSQAAGTEPVEQSLATWVSLPSEGHTQEDTEGGAMVDELASEAAHSESRDPLSMVSQTRESLPYSQYPGTDSRRRAQSVNSDDSDDANEVQETVTRSQPNPPRPSFTFRGLSQIISDVTFGSYVRPRTLGEAEPEDLYGRPKDGESEESGSDSDSEDEKKSHIPKERRAGLKA